MRSQEELYDELLVLRCQQNDVSAFDELVDRWQLRLWRYAYHLTEREDLAWDMVQETWAAVVNGISGLKDAASFPRWIYRILTNRCADLTRRQIRERQLLKSLAGESEVTHKDLTAAEQLTDDLQVAITQLHSDERSLLVLRFGDGLSVRDIGIVLGIPEGTVKSRLHHLKQKLKDITEREQKRDG